MPQIDWDPAMETGDPIVDDQHRGLFRLFNELLLAEQDGDDSSVLQVLEKLTEYVIVHFSAEESLMLLHRYPERLSATHVAEHRRLTETTRELVLDYRTGTKTSVEPLVSFLQRWLADHIEQSDRAFVDYMKQEA
ncbi:MAG TPA: bacteriohemerythrin [Coriobacteriia bacterium]|nr:bacteriohemerythrin [Coriobacteriia bacterium]